MPLTFIRLAIWPAVLLRSFVGVLLVPFYLVAQSYSLDVLGLTRLRSAGSLSPPLEIHMDTPGQSRPGYLLLQANDPPATNEGSTITHYALDGLGGRVQQGAYSFSWTEAATTNAQWELWLRANGDTLVVAKAVPEGSAPGRAFFRLGPDPQAPLDRLHLIDGNIRLQRAFAAQRIAFYEGLTQDWIIEHATDRALRIDSPGRRVLALNPSGGSVGAGGALGVGTLDPTRNLQIESAAGPIVRLLRPGFPADFELENDGTVPAIITRTANPVAFRINNTEVLRVLDGQAGNFALKEPATGSELGGWGLGTAKPACSVLNRGKIWFVPGGIAVGDTFEVCRKDTADNYAWVSLF